MPEYSSIPLSSSRLVSTSTLNLLNALVACPAEYNVLVDWKSAIREYPASSFDLIVSSLEVQEELLPMY